MSDRRAQLTHSSAAIALVAGIAVMANLFSHFAHLRLDFSRGKVYSMSRASKKILRGLPDPVLVKVYYSKELPPQIAANRDYLRDLLNEYRSGSNGKVRVKTVEVDLSGAGKEDAMRDGIAPVRFDIIARDKYEQREGFLGVALQYHDKKESIAFLQDVGGLEYDLTSRIRTLTTAAKPVLAFLQNHKAMGADALDQAVREKLEARYTLKTLDLSTISDEGIPSDVQTVLVVGPAEKFTERELYLLDQFLASGRSLGVAIDTSRVDLRSFFAVGNPTGLEDLLARHGVKPLSTIVLDQQSQPIQISMQQGPFMMTNVVQYPPFVVGIDLNASNPVTKGLDSVVLPFGCPLEVSSKTAGGHAEVLVRSSRYSWAKPDKTPGIMLHPFQFPGPADSDLKGPFAMAAVIDGEFPPALPAPKGLKAKAPLTKAAKAGRLAVVGTSKFLASSYRVPPANFAFLQNLIDWLAMDAELIGIRSKSVAFHPLKEIPAGEKAAIRYALIFGPPFLAVGAGLARWRSRRRARARRVVEYGPARAAAAAS